MKVASSIDPELQKAAEQAIQGRLAGVGPSASLVAIENKTGQVKAMVGGVGLLDSARSTSPPTAIASRARR